jgi:hypothetical protein
MTERSEQHDTEIRGPEAEHLDEIIKTSVRVEVRIQVPFEEDPEVAKALVSKLLRNTNVPILFTIVDCEVEVDEG